MPASIALPTGLVPSNLVLPPGARALALDGDLYNICEQVKEISDRLSIVLLENDPREEVYAIMERCEDHVDRLIFKVKELDGRVIKKLRLLFSVPFARRLKLVEEENYRFEQAEKEREAEDLYERVGRPMWTDLEKCGFIDRPVSYPKAGVATRGRSRK